MNQQSTMAANFALAAGSPTRTLETPQNMINHNNNSDNGQSHGEIVRQTNNRPGRFGSSSETMARHAGTQPYGHGRNSGSPNPPPACGLHPNWRTYTFVDVFVNNLPPHVTTLDLYKNFAAHGEISKIVIFDTRDGGWKNQADIRFK